MMKNVFLLAALSLCLFQSCDNDDDGPIPSYVSAETKTAFDEKYPSAKDVEWETHNDYLVVDFKQDKVGTVVKFRHYESIGRLSR